MPRAYSSAASSEMPEAPQEQVAEGRKQLAAELIRAQQQLRAVQDLYGVLADDNLQRKATTS